MKRLVKLSDLQAALPACESEEPEELSHSTLIAKYSIFGSPMMNCRPGVRYCSPYSLEFAFARTCKSTGDSFDFQCARCEISECDDCNQDFNWGKINCRHEDNEEKEYSYCAPPPPPTVLPDPPLPPGFDENF